MDREPLIANKDATDAHIRRALKRKGFSDRSIESYLRGWNLVKSGSNLKPKIYKETKNDQRSKKSRK